MPKVRIPATTANFGAGFDTLGMALALYNEVEFSVRQAGVDISICEEDGTYTADNERNLVFRAVTYGLNALNIEVPGLVIRQKNAIPRTRGLGSSAACVVAGLCIARHISRGMMDDRRLIDLATEMEGHPDNVLPAVLGGLTVGCMDGGHVRYARIVPPERLRCCVMTPPYTVSTRQARVALPETVTRADAVYNISRSALLVAAMATGDFSLLQTATEDRLHQRYRARFIPRYEKTMQRAKELGARACFISGSGPTLVALLDDGYETFLREMLAFQQGFNWCIEVVSPNLDGAVLMEE